MLIACWSAKGGAGTTVVSASLALMLRDDERDVLIADLAGDMPAVLGAPEPDSPGLAAWLQANGADVALKRLEEPIRPGLTLLPRGQGDLSSGRRGGGELAAVLERDGRHVITDCGTVRGTEWTAATAVADAAEHSWLVIRPDYLSLRHANAARIHATGAIVISQPGRSLGGGDVERVLQVPVIAEIDDDPAVARAVDAGLLSGPVPRSLQRALQRGVHAPPRAATAAPPRIDANPAPEAAL